MAGGSAGRVGSDRLPIHMRLAVAILVYPFALTFCHLFIPSPLLVQPHHYSACPRERTPAVSYLLNLVYLSLLAIAWPWLAYKSLRQGKYREGFAAKFLGRVPPRQGRRPCLWLHAVSVGEVNLLAPLLAEIGRRRPEWECAISTTTMTGYALARKKYSAYSVFYCPLDFSWAVRRQCGGSAPTAWCWRNWSCGPT